MTVVDLVLAPTPQPRQPLHQPLRVPDFQVVGEQPHFHPLTDQPTGHRVDVAAHVDRAPRIHPHPQPPARLQTPRRQRSQQRHFFHQPLLPPRIELREQLPQEVRVRRAARKIPAAPQHQGLVQRPLELAVALLHVAVLVGFARVDRLALQAVVPQQRLIPIPKLVPLRSRRHRRTQTVRTVDLRHAAQLRQGVLQAVAETLEALGEADRPRLPVRVGQDEVVHQVRKGRGRDGDTQVGAVGEVRGRQPARMVDLAEEDLLGWPVQGPPLLDPPLQGSQLAIRETSRIQPLQPAEQGLGFQARVERQLLLEQGPDLGERVGPGSPGMVHAYLAGELAEPPVAACRLVIHAGLGSRQSPGQSGQVESAES